MESLFLPQWQAFLRYQDLPGDAPAQVYLSGLGGSAWPSFTHIIREPGLAKARTILVDMFGHGFSDGPDTFDYTLESHATTIAMLLDHLAITNCVVIGHSMGGSVAIMLAVLRPELVTRLVVLEGNLDPGGGAFSRGVAAQSEEAFVANGYATLLEQVYAEGRSGDAVAATIAGMLQLAAPHALHRSAVGLVQGTQPTMREHFLKLSMPRCYLFGERSLPDPDTERLPAEGIPILIVPDAAHGMLWDNPTGFASVLKHALTL